MAAGEVQKTAEREAHGSSKARPVLPEGDLLFFPVEGRYRKKGKGFTVASVGVGDQFQVRD